MKTANLMNPSTMSYYGNLKHATAEPDRRLDYIFIDERLAVVNAGPWKNKRTGSMDHDPFVADLLFVTP